MTPGKPRHPVREGLPGRERASGGRGLASWRRFELAHPGVAGAFVALREACWRAGPLDDRAAALVKLAVSVGSRAERTTYAHARKALAAGASPGEMRHVALLALPIIGLSAMRDALDRIDRTLDEAMPAAGPTGAQRKDATARRQVRGPGGKEL